MGFIVGKRQGSIKHLGRKTSLTENMNRVRKMRRTEVACAECRRRKLKVGMLGLLPYPVLIA
ncbi:hypothetical protein BDV06DRAFT_204322 [Aspergillus oleicola]